MLNCRLNVSKLENFIVDLFKKMGLSEENAKNSAEVLIQADLTGVTTHGVSKLAFYSMRYHKKAYNLNPKINQVNNDEKLMLLDGDNGSGLVVGPKVLDECIKKTKENGISIVVTKNSGHFGAGNYYAWKFVQNNLIGIIMTNTAPLVSPLGGKKRELGTNPIAIGIPSEECYPIVLDMATSKAAYGKIQIANINGQKIPKDWAYDEEGVETTDPKRALKGSLQSMSGHKGYGLAIIVDAFTSLLANSYFGDGIGSLADLDSGKSENISHCMIGIDPSRFYDVDVFKSYVDEYIKYIKNSPKAVNSEEILMPGEIEYKKFNENKEHGIPFTEEQSRLILDIAKSWGYKTEGYKNLEDFLEDTF